MTETKTIEELNRSVDALLEGDAVESLADPTLAAMLALATDLQRSPDPEFKEDLKAELLKQAQEGSHSTSVFTWRRVPAGNPRKEILLEFPGSRRPLYPMQRTSFMASVLAHATALALIVTAGIWAAQRTHEIPRVSSTVLTDLSPFIPVGAGDKSGGGGGGGDHSKLQASKGTPPRFVREQLTPPAIVVRNENRKLTAEATTIGPPEVTFPKGLMGDPFSGALGPASNGTGSAGGIGEGSFGGVGPGRGPGVGPGEGGGIGGGIYRPGVGGVSAPHPIYDPEPEYSEEGRRAKYQGSVLLYLVVDAEGRPREVRVVRSLGFGLDEKALEAVRRWRFEPAKRNGQPVAVMVNIEVNFRLF